LLLQQKITHDQSLQKNTLKIETKNQSKQQKKKHLTTKIIIQNTDTIDTMTTAHQNNYPPIKKDKIT
jgi:hypothetical protein